MSQERGPGASTFLPNPLEGLPSPPGAPDSLYERSTDFERAAVQLDDIGRQLATLLLQAPSAWEGDAARTFHQTMSERPGIYRRVAAGYRKASSAISGYASALEHAQTTHAASRGLCDADAFRQQGLFSADPTYQFDLFSPDRIRARRQLEAALERLRASTARAAGVLRTLESTLTGRPPVKPEICRGRGESTMQAGDELREKGTDDLRALWELHRLVTPAQAEAAWKQSWEEFADEVDRALTNPLRYLGDEAYATANVEEFQAGNDARAFAGLGYNLLMRGPMKLGRWISPDGRRRDDHTDAKKETTDK